MSSAEPVTVDFRGFVASLAATAAMSLNSVESLLQPADADADADAGDVAALSSEDRTQQIEHGLMTARHLIDTIAMLEEKTAGNLTDDERQLVQSSITELRMSFVRVAGKTKQGS